jgi:hypothetical protein
MKERVNTEKRDSEHHFTSVGDLLQPLEIKLSVKMNPLEALQLSKEKS